MHSIFTHHKFNISSVFRVLLTWLKLFCHIAHYKSPKSYNENSRAARGRDRAGRLHKLCVHPRSWMDAALYESITLHAGGESWFRAFEEKPTQLLADCREVRKSTTVFSNKIWFLLSRYQFSWNDVFMKQYSESYSLSGDVNVPLINLMKYKWVVAGTYLRERTHPTLVWAFISNWWVVSVDFLSFNTTTFPVPVVSTSFTLCSG